MELLLCQDTFPAGNHRTEATVNSSGHMTAAAGTTTGRAATSGSWQLRGSCELRHVTAVEGRTVEWKLFFSLQVGRKVDVADCG